MGKFADFQTRVCDKLFRNGVDTEQVRLFVISQFPPGDCIPPPPASLTEVFKAITQHGLWNYFHYSPLVRIARRFDGDDHEMKGWVQTYKQDLKAYNVVTTVEEYIETDLEIAGPPSAKRARYDLATTLQSNGKLNLLTTPCCTSLMYGNCSLLIIWCPTHLQLPCLIALAGAVFQ